MNKKISFKPKTVISIHGIMSRGRWQSKAKNVIEQHGLMSAEFNYGFVIRPDRMKVNKLVEKFHTWYLKLKKDETFGFKDEPFHRPSIVAHSLGTWIVAKAMRKYPDIKFDKIFLHGSIIPRGFDWYSLILSDQVNRVITERSKKDWVVILGFVITRSFFPCCRFGFIQQSTCIKYERVERFTHSDFQYEDRFDFLFNKYLYEVPIQLEMVHGENLTLTELKKYFKETLPIDLNVYGQEYAEQQITIERALEWASIEKNIWSFMIDSYVKVKSKRKKVLGYINAIAVTDWAMSNFLTGELVESNLTANHIQPFSTTAEPNIIILSVALSRNARDIGGYLNAKPGEFLMMALSNKLTSVLAKGKKIKRIAALAWSAEGENLCRSFGLIDTGVRQQGHPIYAATRTQLRLKHKKDLHPLCNWWIKKVKS